MPNRVRPTSARRGSGELRIRMPSDWNKQGTASASPLDAPPPFQISFEIAVPIPVDKRHLLCGAF